MRPFVRIAGNLSLTTRDLSANIPPFNAAAHADRVGAAGAAAAEDPTIADAAEPDAEVSFVMRDLAPMLPQGARSPRWSPIDEVMMRVREASNWRGNSGVRYTPAMRRPTPAAPARHQAGLCHRGQRRRSLCRLRSPHRAREHHAAAEDHGPDHRRQCLPANASSWSRRATPSRRSCAIRAPRRKNRSPSPPCSVPAAATAASRKARSCAS